MLSIRRTLVLGVALALVVPPVLAAHAKASNQSDLVPEAQILVQRGNGSGGGNNGNGNGSGKGNDKGGGNSSNSSDNGNNGNGGGNSGNSSGNSSNAGGSNQSPSPSSTRQPRSYMGQVTVSTGGLVISGSVRIQSNSPWLSLAIPGMWLEATGVWEDEVFVATDVKLHSSVPWAFYQGPASLVGAGQYQFVSAWLTNSRSDPFLALRAAGEQSQVRVVAYFDGSKFRALPTSFPVPPGLKPGWYELIGTLGPQGLVWSSTKTFP